MTFYDFAKTDFAISDEPGLYEYRLALRAWNAGRHAADKPIITENNNALNPNHYTSHPSGVECITITEHMGFNLGNAIKYIWRAGLKNDAIEDLKKAMWYIDREIMRRSVL